MPSSVHGSIVRSMDRTVFDGSPDQLQRLIEVEHGRIHNEAVPLPGVVLAVADLLPARLGQPWDVNDSLFGAPAVLGSVGADDFHLDDPRSGGQAGVAPGVTAYPQRIDRLSDDVHAVAQLVGGDLVPDHVAGRNSQPFISSNRPSARPIAVSMVSMRTYAAPSSAASFRAIVVLPVAGSPPTQINTG